MHWKTGRLGVWLSVCSCVHAHRDWPARTAERRFRRKRTNADKRVWADKLKAMREFYEAKRSSFWRTTISANSGISQKLWRTLWTVVHSQQKSLAVNICVLPLSGSWEFAARQSSWPRTESQYFQTSAEDIYFCEILTTKCIKHIRDLFEYALYKFTLYLLTYLPCYASWVVHSTVHPLYAGHLLTCGP